MFDDRRANVLVGVVLLLGLTVIIGAAAAYPALQDSPGDAGSGETTTNTVSAQNETTTDNETNVEDDRESENDSENSRDVEIVFEQWDDKVYVAANGGDDLANVTAFEVTGAKLNGTLDADTDYPEVHGTVTKPTTVEVTATFEDGSTQVVGTLRVESEE